MRKIIKRFTGYVILIIVVFFPAYSFQETPQIIDNQDGPIEILAKSFEADIKKSTITFLDDIQAVRNDIKINCQKLVVFLSDNNTSNDVRTQIERIEATEKVKISRSDGSIATAEKAVYYPDENKVILTGNSVLKLKRGENINEAECDKITVDLKEGRYSCEGAEDGKARAVFFPPKKEKR
jgi:lipopolysaccharide transport protein LptA